MKITGKKDNDVLQVVLDGRLDTTTAPELEKYLQENLKDIKEVIFDFASLAYVSSSGLRVLLSTQKKMNRIGGKMVLRNVNDLIMEIFDAVGFVDILTIEND